jgi:SAM-dependent methyltransferase
MTSLRDAERPFDAIEAEAHLQADRAVAKLARGAVGRPSLAPEIAALARLLERAQMTAAKGRRAIGPRPSAHGSEMLEMARRVKAMRGRLRAWSRVLEALHQIERRRTFPLLDRGGHLLDISATQRAIADRSFTQVHRAVNPQVQAASAGDLGCFPDIALSVTLFTEIAHLAYRILLARKARRPARFLDVGCGGGLKVVIAAQFFDRAEGIEFDPGYAETARRTFAALDARRCSVIEGDALAFAGYGDYDVIYLYRPMRNDALQAALEARIVAMARPGTVILAPFGTMDLQAEGCRPIQSAVFVAGISAAEAEGLRRETLRMGPHVASPERPLPRDLGWLSPLWLACEANGFCPANWP